MTDHKKNSSYLNSVWPLLLMLLFLFGCDNSSKNFTEFLYELSEIDVDKRAVYVDDWIKKQEEFPLIDGNDVYFIFKEKREVPVLLTGDMIAGNSDPVALVKIIGTDYYYTLQTFPLNSAFEYKFIANGRHFLDPMNRKIIKSKDGIRSLLFMPEYDYPVETLMRVNKVYSRLDTLKYNDSDIYLYRHPESNNDSPLIIFLKGKDYLQYAEANIILDNLISNGQIEPCLAVFPATDFDIIRMYDFLKKKYNFQNRLIIVGGNQNAGLSWFRNPQILKKFDAFFIQSALADSSDLNLTEQWHESDLSGKSIFIGCGHYEGHDSLYQVFTKFLHGKTEHLKIEKYNEGASWLSWKGHLDDALIYLTDKKSGPSF